MKKICKAPAGHWRSWAHSLLSAPSVPWQTQHNHSTLKSFWVWLHTPITQKISPAHSSETQERSLLGGQQTPYRRQQQWMARLTSFWPCLPLGNARRLASPVFQFVCVSLSAQLPALINGFSLETLDATASPNCFSIDPVMLRHQRCTADLWDLLHISMQRTPALTSTHGAEFRCLRCLGHRFELRLLCIGDQSPGNKHLELERLIAKIGDG